MPPRDSIFDEDAHGSREPAAPRGTRYSGRGRAYNFERPMNRRLTRLAAVAISAACGGAATPAPAPAPAPTPVAVTPAAPATPDTMRSYAVPAFRTDTMIAWGPLPPGTPHPERARIDDLQHQVVHVRFDRPRHAVVGSTTIRVAALDKPLTTIPLDAVGMTIQKVVQPRRAGTRGAGDDEGRPSLSSVDARRRHPPA